MADSSWRRRISAAALALMTFLSGNHVSNPVIVSAFSSGGLGVMGSLCPQSPRAASVCRTCERPFIYSTTSSTRWSRRNDRQRRDSICRLRAATIMAAASSTTPHHHANLAIRLDEPLLPSPRRPSTTASLLWKSFVTLFSSKAFKIACVTLIAAFAWSALLKSSSSSISSFSPYSSNLSPFTKAIGKRYKLTKGRVLRIYDRVQSKLLSPQRKQPGTPMTFDHAEGWGVCTLAAKTRLGRSNYLQYDFDLPGDDVVLNLGLGQQVTLCCLNLEDKIVKGDFYLFSERGLKGGFSVLAPDVGGNGSSSEKDGDKDAEYEIGSERTTFARVLKHELEVGDEVAIKPGLQTLYYRGQFLPVTDMVYFTYGLGIVPVMEQVKAILPTGSSSVTGLSVIWMNKSERNFDVALSMLENMYFKYSTKLAVSCIVDGVRTHKLEGNREVEEAVPKFQPGTMAVLSGPRGFLEMVRAYLTKRGYPEDCICLLS